MSPRPSLNPRDFISPSPSPSSPRSTSFTSNHSLPWIIIGIVVGLTVLATSTTIIIIYYNRRQRQRQKQNNPNHTTPSQSQLITPTPTPSTTQLQPQQQQTPPLNLSFLRRDNRRKDSAATQRFEQEELQRASMIRKSYASRSWNSLSLDSQMSLSMSQLSPTRTVGTLGTYYGSSSRVNTLERVNTTERMMMTDNTYNEQQNMRDMKVDEDGLETPTTPTELRGTTATEDRGGRGTATSRLKDDWKAWEARVKLERSVSGELHPVYTAAADAGTETETAIYGTECGGVARTVKAGEVPIPPRHPGRIESPSMM